MHVFRAEYPGQEDVECWLVIYFDGYYDALTTKEEFREAIHDPENPMMIVGENLTLVGAALLVEKLEKLFPERRYYALPVRLKKLS
jgi:hypothetical protein